MYLRIAEWADFQKCGTQIFFCPDMMKTKNFKSFEHMRATSGVLGGHFDHF